MVRQARIGRDAMQISPGPAGAVLNKTDIEHWAGLDAGLRPVAEASRLSGQARPAADEISAGVCPANRLSDLVRWG